MDPVSPLLFINSCVDVHGPSLTSTVYCLVCRVRESRHPQASLYYIMAGKSKLLEYESWQQMTFIDQIIMHEAFNASSYENDIALVRVKTPFTLQTPTVRPVCFPASTHTLPAGTLCYLAGFGDTLGELCVASR